MNMKRWKIYLDLDGVIVDLVTPIFNLHNVWCREDEYPQGFQWDIMGACDHLREASGLSPLGMTVEEFWTYPDRSWWANLKPYPTALAFVEWLETGPYDITLLTAHAGPASAAGKVDWINEWLPDYWKKCLIGHPKEECAGPGCILIDDRDKNCADFIEAGGMAITVPRPWNSAYNVDTSFNIHGGFRRPVYNVVADRLYKITGVIE